jgi:ketosteroid isomerase-like protein
MSRPIVEGLRAYLDSFDSEALSRGEIECPYLASDCTYADEILPDHVGEVYRGSDGIGRAGRAFLAPYESHSIELERIVDGGACVVSIHRFRATARHTGIQFDVPLAWLFKLRDGEVIHWHAYSTEEEALKAAGVSD